MKNQQLNSEYLRLSTLHFISKINKCKGAIVFSQRYVSVYDKRDDFDFRIVNFPHMDSNIPANPAYGIYISQLVRYARICTSKADFLRRLRQVSSRLHRQGFKSAFLLRSLTKFFNHHGAIIGKFDATLRELRTAVHE